MTERKPSHESVDDFVERQILDAQERGDFDGLRGHGQPIPGIGRPDDELWWVRRKLRDENVTELPPALLARRVRDQALVDAAAAPSEEAVVTIVTHANELIRRVNRTAVSGPPTATMPLDVDEVVAAWRARPPRDEPDAPPPEPEPEPPARRWWWPFRRR